MHCSVHRELFVVGPSERKLCAVLTEVKWNWTGSQGTLRYFQFQIFAKYKQCR